MLRAMGKRTNTAVLIAAWLMAVPAGAETRAEPAPAARACAHAAAEGARTAPPPPSAFRPADRGAPAGTEAGGQRGQSQVPGLALVAPSSGAPTRRAAPDLYWYLDAPLPAGSQAVFTVIGADALDPLVERRLRVERYGLQVARVADAGVELESGTRYEWSIAVVLDDRQRDLDVVAFGELSRAPDETGAAPAAPAWYDAVDAVLEDWIDAEPRPGRGAVAALVRCGTEEDFTW